MAGTTTRLGLPFPEGNDLVSEGNDVIQAAAEKLDSSSMTLKRIAGGSGTAPASGTASTSLAVTYPSGRFPSAPQCVLVTASSNSSAYTAYGIGAQSATGFTARLGTNVGTGTTQAINFMWLACLY